MHIVVSSDQLALAEEEIILKMNWSWRVRNTRLLLFAPLPSLDPTLPHGGLRHKKMRTDIKNMYLRICQHMHGAPLHDNPPLRWLGYTTRLTQGLTLLCGLCFRPDFFLCRERHLNGSQANSFFSLAYITCPCLTSHLHVKYLSGLPKHHPSLLGLWLWLRWRAL